MNHPRPVRRYRLSDAGNALSGDVVLTRERLQQLREADCIVSAARQACARRLWASRRRGQERTRRRLVHELEIAQARQRAHEREWALQARQSIEALQAAKQQIQLQADPLTWQLACAALKRLLLDMPAQSAVTSSVRLMLATLSNPAFTAGAVLRVNTEDAAAIAPPPPDAGWSIVSDATLPRGSCVLTHDNGSDRTNFRCNVEAIVGALTAATPSMDASAQRAEAVADEAAALAIDRPDGLDASGPSSAQPSVIDSFHIQEHLS